MATIRKQSIYSSIYIYAGFAIGAFNVLFLFPKFFTPEEFGLTRILMDIAFILSFLLYPSEASKHPKCVGFRCELVA